MTIGEVHGVKNESEWDYLSQGDIPNLCSLPPKEGYSCYGGGGRREKEEINSKGLQDRSELLEQKLVSKPSWVFRRSNRKSLAFVFQLDLNPSVTVRY